MGQFKNVSGDARWVAYGSHPQEVPADGVLTVQDEADESYACQPSNWEPVAPAPAPEKAATPEPAPAPAADPSVAAPAAPAA